MADPDRLGQTELAEKFMTVVSHLLEDQWSAKPAPTVPVKIDPDNMKTLFERRDEIVEAFSPK
jgi:hypothetical protein